MKCKVKKYIYRRYAFVELNNCICTSDMIINIVKILNAPSVVLALESGIITEGVIYKLIEKYKIKQYFFQRKSLYGFVLIPAENLNGFLSESITYTNIFLFDLRDDSYWSECCENINKINGKYLIKNKISSMAIEINRDENYAVIDFDFEVYDVKDIINNIKSFI